MTSTPKSPHRSIASLKLAVKVPALIAQAQNIVEAMMNNASFPSPTPSLDTVTKAVQDLQTAESATLSRTKSAVAVRNERRLVLVRMLQQLKNYIQGAKPTPTSKTPPRRSRAPTSP